LGAAFVARHLAYSFAHAFSGLSMKKIPATPLIAITQVRAMSAGNNFCNATTPITPAAANRSNPMNYVFHPLTFSEQKRT
jgi:hypothetical protein